MSETTGQNQQVSIIDFWRGVSVVFVITHHVAIRLPLAKSDAAAWLPDRLMMALSWNGSDAVAIFFVISGFLITMTTLKRDGTPADVDLRGFWGRRVARIAPPLFALVGVLSAMHLLGVPHHTIDLERQSLGMAILSATTFWLNVYEGRTGYLPGGWDVLWSLSIEEVFYLGFPLLLLATKRSARLAMVLVPFALLLPVFHTLGEGDIWRDKAYLPGMAFIAAGVVSALVTRRVPLSLTRDRLLVGAGTLALVGTLGWGDLLWPVLHEGTLLVRSVGVSCILIGGYGLRQHKPWRATAPVRSFGRLSYEIYLTHMFVVFGAVEMFSAFGWGKPEGWLAYPVVLIGAWGLGWLFATLWSEPANRRIRRWLFEADRA